MYQPYAKGTQILDSRAFGDLKHIAVKEFQVGYFIRWNHDDLRVVRINDTGDPYYKSITFEFSNKVRISSVLGIDRHFELLSRNVDD